MSEKRFSIEEAIKFGWDTMKGNAGFLIVLLIIAFLIENLPGMIARSVRNDLAVTSSILYLAGWLLGFVVQMGLIKVCLKFCDGIKGEIDDLLSSFNLLATFAVGSVLYFLIILGGLILMIIPGIIWGIKFSFFSYFIVDKGLGPVQALKASAAATAGAKWDLFLFGLLLLLINLAGALCFLIGLFATIPTSMIAYAYVYRKLSTGKAATGPAAEMYSI